MNPVVAPHTLDKRQLIFPLSISSRARTSANVPDTATPDMMPDVTPNALPILISMTMVRCEYCSGTTLDNLKAGAQGRMFEVSENAFIDVVLSTQRFSLCKN